MDEEIQNQLETLLEKVNELEQRVATLEKGESRSVSTVPNADSNAASSGDSAGLMEAIKVALSQLGEADAGAIRQQLVKNGQPNSLTRSDVNKALYRNTTVFAVARQEGMKPFWKLA